LIQLGQTSLLVYWVHIEFVYGRLSIVPKHGAGIRTASLGLLVIFLGMLLLSIWRTNMRGRGGWIRWRTGVRSPVHPEAGTVMVPARAGRSHLH